MSRNIRIAATAILLNFSTLVAAMPFSEIVVFGDSLSDIGNFAVVSGGTVPGPAYVNGRFSNGPNYADVMAERLGMPLLPSVLGGTNYAFGGARTDFHPNLPDINPDPGIVYEPSIKNQVALYLATRTVDPLALHILWAGANDLQEALEAVGTALFLGMSQDEAFAAGAAVAMQAANNVLGMVGDLLDAGVGTLLLPNIPDIGTSPRVAVLGAESVAVAGLLTDVLNGTLDALLSRLGAAEIVRFDVASEFDELISDPASFGLANITDQCANGAFPGGPPVASCADPDTHLFWDDFHPTTAAHAQIARAALTAIPEPATLLLLLCGLVVGAFTRKRLHSDRLDITTA